MALTINYAINNRLLLHDLSFSSAAGECTAITGANGSGKSTLLRILAGLLEPDSGSVEWHDSVAASDCRVLYLGHRNGLSGALTPRENLQVLIALHGQPPTMSVAAALERCGVTDDRPCAQLSAGQQQRVVLARLLTCPAPVWLLDEPLAALDHKGQLLFSELLDHHLQQGQTALISNHNSDLLPAVQNNVELGQ